MKFSYLKTAVWIAAAMILVQTSPLNAMDHDGWAVHVGAQAVDPKSNNSAVASVKADVQMSVGVSYMFDNNWGVEVLGALPFDFQIASAAGTVGSVDAVLPTASVLYHIEKGRFQPYFGLGINYAIFGKEAAQGPWAGNSLKFDNSWGLAGQVGLNYEVSEVFFLNAQLRYIDIDSDVSLGGTALASFEIDPVIAGINLGWRF